MHFPYRNTLISRTLFNIKPYFKFSFIEKIFLHVYLAMKFNSFFAVCTLSLSLLPLALPGAAITWDAGGGGSRYWDTEANWSDNLDPVPTNDYFVSTSQTVWAPESSSTFGGASLTFNGGTLFFLGGNGARTYSIPGLTINGATLRPHRNNTNATTIEITSPIQFLGTNSIVFSRSATQTQGQSLTLSGDLTGLATLNASRNYTAPMTLNLSGNNSVSGGFSSTGIDVVLSHSSGWGTGDAYFRGGTVTFNTAVLAATSRVHLDNDVAVAIHHSSTFGALTGGSGSPLITIDSGKTLTVGVINSGGTYVGTIGGSGNLTFDGNSYHSLLGNNSYTGETNVNSGWLIIQGDSSAATGDVTVAPGGALGGYGKIGGATTLRGVLSPGDYPGIGTFTVNNDVTWGGSATKGTDTDWIFDLGADNSSDLLSLTGDFLKDASAGSHFRFNFLGSTATGTFTLVDWDDANATTFSASDFSYTNLGDGNAGSFFISGSSLVFGIIPEPSVALINALGLVVLLRRRRD